MHAARNISLCTKDCVCLFVCPTGATDTENGQIDFAKCQDGCRLCVDACPSHAIYLVPSVYPPPQEKSEAVRKSLFALAKSKAGQERLARSLAEASDDPVFKQLMHAIAASNRVLAEDCYREAGYILPQSEAVTSWLKQLLSEHSSDKDFPSDAVKALLEKL
ncbi:4Fe-4S ferredoxin [Sphaerochaeta sp. S2]|uniref:4Fe-4S ferredoxin n=1 Tax=Sphaerochaeta sp. S2 TaxID=2798868 RepID=UPI0018E959C7|nr:4Fe-4S ferredoxin [Sphaerochaeta sp. S2]MBJ2355484.1 4Fe-4S ferredoxin [Sphaerochaeta sp. S2]